MKNLYLSAICLFFTALSFSQTTYTWNGGNGSWGTSTKWSPNGVPGNNDLVQFNSGGTFTVSGISSSYTLARLSVSNNSNVTLEYTSNRTLTIGGATGTDLTVSSGSTLVLGNGITIDMNNNATADISGTLTITDRFFNSDNSGALTTVSGTINNTGGSISSTTARLTFAAGGKYIHARSGNSIPAATWNAASTCEITGLTGGDPSGDNQAFGNLIYNSPSMSGNRNLGASGLSVAGNLQIINVGTAELRLALTPLNITGNLVLNSGTFRIGDNTNRTINVGGNVSITGGTLLMTTGNNTNDLGILNVAGNFTQSGGVIDEDDDGRGQINFNGTTVQTYTKTGGSNTNNIDYAILTGSTVDFGTSVLNGSSGTFTIQAGAKMIQATSNPIQVTGTKTFSSGADYEFTGASTGTFVTSPSANTARDIIINRTGGAVTLSQPMTVTRDMKLLNGELNTTTTNIITINDNATISAYSNTSFIVGPIIKKGNDDFTFPVGRTGAGLIPIRISGLSGSSDFKAEYKRLPANLLGSISSIGLHHVSHCEYWTLDRTGSATANVTLYWGAFSNCNAAAYVTELSSIVVAHFNGTTWNAHGRNGGTTGSISSGSVTWNTVSSFSPFALGSTSGLTNPLPVSLTNVKAYPYNNSIKVEWTNMSERDISTYIVERSADGRNFTPLSAISLIKNNDDRADYAVQDMSPLSGVNYYRIAAKDINGKTVYSSVLRVETGNGANQVTIYPNPVTGRQLNIGMANARPGTYNLSIYNGSGIELLKQVITSQGSAVTESVNLPYNMAPGIYSLMITGNNYREIRKVIVK